MSDLSSMLVPLVGGNFPSWPYSEPPSVAEGLGVIIGAPLAIGAIIALLVLSGTLIRRARGGGVDVAEPLWIGQTAATHEIAAGTARGALTRGGQPQETMTGGASARW